MKVAKTVVTSCQLSKFYILILPERNWNKSTYFVFVFAFLYYKVVVCLYVMVETGMELVGPSKRLWTGTVLTFFLSTGTEFLILMVYLLRDWRWYVLAVSLPGCLFLPYYWYVDLIIS